MEALLKLLPAPTPFLVRYGLALAGVLLTFALRRVLGGGLGPYGYILFVPVIVISGFLFDRGTGFFALITSAALVASELDWGREGHLHATGLIAFVLIGSGLVFLSEGLHRAIETAAKAQAEKEMLLHEMSHRVKNKFAMISSILALQSRSAPEECRVLLEAVSRRVQVIAHVHDSLQLSRSEGLVEMSDYLSELCRRLSESMGYLRPVSLISSIDPSLFEPKQALATGLLVNELVTNAYKYAFPDDRLGKIQVRLGRQGNHVEVSVTDNGVGCPQIPSEGLGMRFASILAAQLGGEIRREDAAPGCRVSVAFTCATLES